jgi:TatD DNase family protein
MRSRRRLREGFPLIDSHVHLNRSEFTDDRTEVLDRARASGVTGFLNVGYDPETSMESLDLARTHADIRATVGVHPHDAELLADENGTITASGREILAELEDLASADEVVAIGEIGLDYFRDLSPRPAQHAALAAQLELAGRIGLPVVFHVRDAWDDILLAIERIGVPERGGVLHSFSGGTEAVEWARSRGFLLGIGGPVTYKNSRLPDLVALAGADLLLLETDAPWLPPVPHRGQRNESGYLIFTRDKMAEVLDLTPEEVARQTSASFRRLFGLTDFG